MKQYTYKNVKNSIKALIIFMCIFTSASTYSKVEEDKQLHFGVSSIIGYGTTYMLETGAARYGTCIGIGLAKEIYDEYDYGVFSKDDLIYDTLGCVVGVMSGRAISLHMEEDVVYIDFKYTY